MASQCALQKRQSGGVLAQESLDGRGVGIAVTVPRFAREFGDADQCYLLAPAAGAAPEAATPPLGAFQTSEDAMVDLAGGTLNAWLRRQVL